MPVQRRQGKTGQFETGETRGQDDGNRQRHSHEKPPEHRRQQGQTLGRRQLFGSDRTQAEMSEEHAAHPDDDAGEMQEKQEGTHGDNLGTGRTYLTGLKRARSVSGCAGPGEQLREAIVRIVDQQRCRITVSIGDAQAEGGGFGWRGESLFGNPEQAFDLGVFRAMAVDDLAAHHPDLFEPVILIVDSVDPVFVCLRLDRTGKLAHENVFRAAPLAKIDDVVLGRQNTNTDAHRVSLVRAGACMIARQGLHERRIVPQFAWHSKPVIAMLARPDSDCSTAWPGPRAAPGPPPAPVHALFRNPECPDAAPFP